MNHATILLVEDDKNIRKATAATLQLQGYSVLTAASLAAARELAENADPDLVILDILLPDGNGLDYCRELCRKSGARILFLSALNTRQDVVNGLRAGGDDYLPKPFLTEELLLRVGALLRRGKLEEEEPARTGSLEWRSASRQVFSGGNNLQLTPREYEVLAYLCRNSDRYLTAEEIYRAVWNTEPLDDLSAVHNHIYSLRGKLSGTGAAIEHKRGRGYRVFWDNPGEAPAGGAGEK